jgi:hypothetical protein
MPSKIKAKMYQAFPSDLILLDPLAEVRYADRIFSVGLAPLFFLPFHH